MPTGMGLAVPICGATAPTGPIGAAVADALRKTQIWSGTNEMVELNAIFAVPSQYVSI